LPKHIDKMPIATLQELCLTKGLTLSLAESCTGGLTAKLITDHSGASGYFICSCVTYSNEAKISMLGVKAATLEEFGAVSAETATEMAIGVQQQISTSLSLSITGIAGPEGGSEAKPVGTVFFAISGFSLTQSWKMFFSGDRQSIRYQAAEHGITSLVNFIRSKT
jgi:PncC family amidohydrolase